MQYLYRRKIVLFSLLLIGMLGTKAQRAIELNLPDHDDKLYYFGKDVRGNKFKDHQLPKKII